MGILDQYNEDDDLDHADAVILRFQEAQQQQRDNWTPSSTLLTPVDSSNAKASQRSPEVIDVRGCCVVFV